ncbi:NADH dehydrogenase [Nocardia neocaledoniensis NBRC 108232]|uniref:NADH dehydrogenase FAD-containing subunit n=1 Tax=Nocardia neocaledoniensis TaxID=236511 RepID=A0A317NE97_9NOCA|nr:FAD-dependent oxidoreductase [Nocardia neocaledoniensis]PWV73479.1 NADH dehydrogenase FAD-containing subunit [Nocardia neocaledoniensis]GEM30037.1 NADH dehydrogenase [Nocardia neocaledoniensis NBRC 108232]
MTGQQRIVVLGAGYAGLSAARRLAKARDTTITVVDTRAEFVERVRLHQAAAGQRIRRWDLREMLERKGIEYIRAMATAIDPDAKRVHLDGEWSIGYDTLVYALGSAADRTSVPGVAEHAHFVATPEDVRALPAGPVIVVGAGSTGIELAAELAESRRDPGVRDGASAAEPAGVRRDSARVRNGASAAEPGGALPDSDGSSEGEQANRPAGEWAAVTLLGAEEPGAWLSARAVEHIRATLTRLGVEICAGVKVAEVLPDGVRLVDGTVLSAAAVVWTAGFTVPDLARSAGLDVDEQGRIRTDETLRSLSHPDIYAAGDAALVAGPGDRPLRMACATALPTGSYVARAIQARARGTEPKPMTFRYHLQCLSLGRHDAVIQLLNADDTPAERVIRGRTGAWVKENIVRFAGKAAGLR